MAGDLSTAPRRRAVAFAVSGLALIVMSLGAAFGVAGDRTPPKASCPSHASVAIENAGYLLRVRLDQQGPGHVFVHLCTTAPVQSWSATAAVVAPEHLVTLAVLAVGEHPAVAAGVLPRGFTWTLTFRLRTRGPASPVMTTTLRT